MDDRTISFSVDHYAVSLGEYLDQLVEGDADASALILCIGGKYRAQFFFLKEGSPTPEAEYEENDDSAMVTLYLPDSRYMFYVDLLRNERPLHVLIFPGSPELSALYTGLEPPGIPEVWEDDFNA